MNRSARGAITPGQMLAAGSVGDRFYLVRSGRLRAIAPDGADFGTIVPGEGFGELALLDRAERSATVQAIEATELWSLGRGHFNRWVKDRYEVAARIRASRTERTALAGLPFFKGLSGQELDLRRLRANHGRPSAGPGPGASARGGPRRCGLTSGGERVHRGAAARAEAAPR